MQAFMYVFLYLYMHVGTCREVQRPIEGRSTGPNRDRRSQKMGRTGLGPTSVRSTSNLRSWTEGGNLPFPMADFTQNRPYHLFFSLLVVFPLLLHFLRVNEAWRRRRLRQVRRWFWHDFETRDRLQSPPLPPIFLLLFPRDLCVRHAIRDAANLPRRTRVTVPRSPTNSFQDISSADLRSSLPPPSPSTFPSARKHFQLLHHLPRTPDPDQSASASPELPMKFLHFLRRQRE